MHFLLGIKLLTADIDSPSIKQQQPTPLPSNNLRNTLKGRNSLGMSNAGGNNLHDGPSNSDSVSSPNTDTAGISLQIQQWKTVAEFESDEQVKFLLFSQLKFFSSALLYVGISTVLLAMIDIELNHYAKGVSKNTISRFMNPYCWLEQPTIDKNDILNFTVSLFGAEENIMVQGLLEEKIFYGQKEQVIAESVESWMEKRNDDVFVPTSWYYLASLGTRSLVSFFSLITVFLWWRYYQVLLRLQVTKKILPEGSELYQVGLFHKFIRAMILCFLHVPPIWYDNFWNFSEQNVIFSILTIVRLPVIILIYAREHHPMRYNRMTEILCTLSSVKLKSGILCKIPFLRTPLKMIFWTYSISLISVTYLIYTFERKNSGHCLSFLNSLWLSFVTSTNLGYGDYTANDGWSRIILAVCSIIGIIEMALLVNYVSEFMNIPPDEKRILGFYEKHQKIRDLRIAAANLIKSRYKLYRKKQQVNSCFANRIKLDQQNMFIDDEKTRDKKSKAFEKSIKKLIHDSRRYEITYQTYYRKWLKTKSQCDHIQHQLQKGFQVDDTAIAATYISRKLEDLETSLQEEQKERRSMSIFMKNHYNNANNTNNANNQLESTTGQGHPPAPLFVGQTAPAPPTRISVQMPGLQQPLVVPTQNINIPQNQVIQASEKVEKLHKKLASTQNKRNWLKAINKAAPRSSASGISPLPQKNQNVFDAVAKNIKSKKFDQEQEKKAQKLEEEAEHLRKELEQTMAEDMRTATQSDLKGANKRINDLENLISKMTNNIDNLTSALKDQIQAPTGLATATQLSRSNNRLAPSNSRNLPSASNTPSRTNLNEDRNVIRRRGIHTAEIDADEDEEKKSFIIDVAED